MVKPDSIGKEFASLRERMNELEKTLEAHRAALESHVRLIELERENRDLRRLVEGLRQALRELRDGQVERLSLAEKRASEAVELQQEAENERYRAVRRLDQVYSSFTWKAGRTVKRAIDPFLKVRRLIRRTSGREDTSFVNKTPTNPQMVRAESSLTADLEIAEDLTMKSAYETATQKRTFKGGEVGRIVMAVSTLDFGRGRGDLYVAVGLGRYLERIGYEVVYLPEGQWYDPPPETDIYLALLSAVDPSRIPNNAIKVAWARNETALWATNPTLNLYDVLLGSSSSTVEHLRKVYAGRTALLPIAVDLELFNTDGTEQRIAVVSTVNQWGRERDIYRALRSRPVEFPLAIFGHTRGLSSELMPYSSGPVSFFALPAIYRQAVVVLDDFNHTTIEYGNVNSRLFESIAAGAVPITNTRLGLEAVGLGAVPAYANAVEMHDIVADLYEDDDGRNQLASELADVVRREHSYERRAQEFHEILEDGGDRLSTRPIVAFFPDYRATNPYQAILYRAITPDFVPVPVQDILNIKEFDFSQPSGAVLHIHWTAPVLGPAKDSAQALFRLDEFVSQLDSARRSGVRILWTVHNVMPHESKFPDLEKVLRQELADRADLVHVMCDRTLEEIGDRYVVPEGKLRQIRHGSYVDVYPSAVDPDVARERLGFDSEETVLLFLGGIRPYRGVDFLLDAFDKALHREPTLRLVIAGRPGRFPGVEDLERRAISHPLITANFNEIADVDLQHFFKAADVVVLPYRKILNSGSLQLALSFARPVIVPRLGCVPDVETEGVGFSYSPDDIDGLADCLAKSRALKDRGYQEAARRLAEAYTGDDMSSQFKAALVDLMNQASTSD